MEKNLEMEVQIVKKDIAYVKRNVEEFKESFEDVKENVEEVKDSIEIVKEDIAAAHKKIDEELKRRRKTDTNPEVQTVENDYIRRKKQLRDDLVTFYTDRHGTIPLSPLFEEDDTPLVDFYVLPQMNFIQVHKTFPRGEEIKTPVKLLDVFKSGCNISREVYLTADAGYGKTAFSKYLAVTWCQAHSPEDEYVKYFSEDDGHDAINTMREFELLFLVLLRDSSEDCSIDDFIMNQIAHNFSSITTIDFLQEILHRERCLIILDGLDEWTHPERECKKVPKTIPHRNARKLCTVLTTTRPWKLGDVNLNSKQIDKKIELTVLSRDSARKLSSSAFQRIKVHPDEKTLQSVVNKFMNDIYGKEELELVSVPLLLMYRICLWCEDTPIGQSKIGIYTNIIELLLSRTDKKGLAIACEPPQDDLLQCVGGHIHCKKYYTLLKALGQIAFETLLSDKRESTLVFDQSVVRKYLKRDDFLNFSLCTGILIQNTEKHLTRQSTRVSFSHKTMQEYFCALYISCQNENVAQRFNSVQNILDLSKVFVFISGMNAEIMSSVSRGLKSVISKDLITRRYRSVADYDYDYVYGDPMKDIQTMYISCLKENTGNISLCLQDFIIDEDSQQENDFSHLELLAKHNKINLESICIRTDVPSLREIIDGFELHDFVNVKKIFYEGECNEAEIIRLLTSKSVECVTVLSRTWQGNNNLPEYSSWSSELSKTFQNMSQLRAIYIDCFKMDHDVLNELFNYIINRKLLTEIRLFRLSCVTHEIFCGEINLDFSQHLDLRTLELGIIPVSQLEVNVSSLEECAVGELPTTGLVTSYLRELPAATKLHTFECSYLESSDDIETMLQTLPLLVQVKNVGFCNFNLGERSLSLSPEMVNITFVGLQDVTLSGSSLRSLVREVEKHPQSVAVDMRDCYVTPETEFEDVKKCIKTSESFVVIFDGNMAGGRYSFQFKTIKYTEY